jgi:hypothetical protein
MIYSRIGRSSKKEAFTWSRDGIDRNGCPSSGLLILSRVFDRRRRRFAPLTGSTDRKNSLSVAINALLCLLSIGCADQPKIIMV